MHVRMSYVLIKKPTYLLTYLVNGNVKQAACGGLQWRMGPTFFSNASCLRQHFFFERIVNIWNALDDDLVRSSSLNVFKNGLHLLWKNDRLPMGLL